jgi:hypothetical protein
LIGSVYLADPHHQPTPESLPVNGYEALIRALSLIERARADLQAYLDEIDPAFPGQIKFKALATGSS